MMIIVAVILGIVGTMLFIRGLAGLLSAAAASVKRNTTHGLYIFTLRQLHENIVHKYISIGVASILIMLTIMLIADGSTRIMSYGNQMTRGSSVYDFTVTGNEATVEKYLSGKQMQPYIHELAHHLRTQLEYVNEQQLKITDYESYIENWVHEIKKPLSLMTLLLDNRKDEMSPLVHTRMLYVRDHTRQNVEQILYFSRLGAVHKDYYFEPLPILETCKEAVKDNLSLLEEAHFSVTYSGNNCTAISDKKGFMFILGQIISNSVKYAAHDATPAIHFSVSDNKEIGQIVLSICDNGTGIPASDLPFVFDKGFTGDVGSYLSRSTGMGLYLVQKMAKDLAIDLQITSQLSCGTTIILMFPKVQYPVRRFDDATADSYANTKEK